MKIHTISGIDDINKALNASLYATLVALKKDNIINEPQFKECCDNYIAMYIAMDGGFINWVKRKLLKTDIVAVVKPLVDDENN